MKCTIRLAVFAGMTAAAIWPASATNSWAGYHWASNGTGVALKVNTSISSVWDRSVTGAIADWDSSDKLVLTRAASSATPKRCNPIAGQILLCNTTYGQTGWLGIASVWLSNGHISQATTKLNDTYFNTASYNSPEWRALVACQEIGHDFGLDHQDVAFANVNLGTCMDYTNAPLGGLVGGFDYGRANITPNAHDYDELRIIYSHPDAGFGATNFGIRQFGKPLPDSVVDEEPGGDDPADWGQVTHRDGQGRPDQFIKTVGPGRKMVTSVFWAIGEGPQ